MVNLMAFGLSATDKTELVRCAESERQAIVAAKVYDRLLLVLGRGMNKNAKGTDFTAVMSFLCCLEHSFSAQLSFTLLNTATLLLKLHRRKRLLSMAPEHYFQQATCKPVLTADREQSAMTSWVHQTLVLFARLNKARL